MNPTKLFEIFSTPIVVLSDIDPTEAPEVIGATIQANATIIAAIITLVATILGVLLTKEKEKSKKLENHKKN
jgi:hypothetical protein